MMIQHKRHIVEHNLHDGPFVESQLVAPVDPMMEEDEKPSLGPTIDGGQTDA